MTVCKRDNQVKVSVKVENVGKVAGKEVVELFVEAPKTNFIKPLRELRGFEKVYLEVGEEKQIDILIDCEDLRYYTDNGWKNENGVYKLQLCSDVNTVILEEEFEITNGEELESSQDILELYSNKERMLAITDSDFEKVIGRPIYLVPISRPYDLNTPMREYKTVGGKFLFGLFTFVFKCVIKFAGLTRDKDDRETKKKNAFFALRTIRTMSLRSLSYASEGLVSHRMAEGMLDIANNKPFKGLWKIITHKK